MTFRGRIYFLGSIFFFSGVLGVIDPRKKFDRENSSEVRKMLGCSNQNYENLDFIRRRRTCMSSQQKDLAK